VKSKHTPTTRNHTLGKFSDIMTLRRFIKTYGNT